MIRMRHAISSAAALLMCLLPQAGHAGWSESRSKHFIVYSDGSTKQLQTFTEQLEKFDYLLRKVTGTPDEGKVNPVYVYMLPSSAMVHDVARASLVEGFYRTNDRHAYAVVSRERPEWRFDLAPEDILFHEYAHHFMLHYFPAAYPVWYVEGFAEYYSEITFPKNGGIGFGNIPMVRAPGLLTMPLYPLDKLLAGEGLPRNGRDVDLFYGTAWALVHYFRSDEKRGREFERYLRDITSGKPDMAPDAYFDGGTKALTKEVSSYLRGRLYGKIFQPDEMPAFPVTVGPMEEGRAALIVQELKQDRGMPKEERQKFAAEVREKAARYPASAYAQSLIADVEASVDDTDAALAAADRAIAIDPKFARAWSIRARILLDRAASSDKADDWKMALAAIVKANRSDLEDPVPLAQFYEYHRRRGGTMPEVGYDGLEKAFVLLPQNDDYRMNFAISLADRMRFADAAKILAPLAFSPHASEGRDAVAKLRAEYLAKAENAQTAVSP